MKKLLNINKWWLLAAAWVYTFTFVFNHYWSRSASYESIAKAMGQRIGYHLQDFNALCEDTVTIQKLSHFDLEGTRKIIGQPDVFYYVYQAGANGLNLRFWSSAGVLPSASNIPAADTTQLVNYPDGSYILASCKIANTTFTMVQLILVKQEYYVQNKNLKKAFPGYADLEQHVAISLIPTLYPVKAGSRPVLFYLKPLQNEPVVLFNWASLAVQVVALLLLLIFFYRTGIDLSRQKKLLFSFIWMAAAAIIVRLSIAYFSFPLNVTNLELYQKRVNSNWFFPSPMGLLLNLIMLAWFTYFIIRTRFAWLPHLETLGSKQKKLLAVAAILVLLPASFLLVQLFISLVLQQNISFDVANFFGLGWSTVCAIACLYFICVLHYRLLHIGNELFARLWPGGLFIKYGVLATGGLLLLTLFMHRLQTSILVLVLLWLVVSLLMEDKLPGLFLYSMERQVRFVFWLVWYAFAGTLLVQSQQKIKETERKMQLARNLARHSDSHAESLLYQTLNDPATAQLRAHSLLFTDSTYNVYFRQQLLRALSNRLDGYTLKMYLFTTGGKPMYNTDSTTFLTLNTVVEQQGAPTRFRNIYFYENSFDKFSYIVKQPLLQDSLDAGYLFITGTPAIFNSQALAPELFKPLQPVAGTEGTGYNYAYAVYDHGNLLYSTRNYPFTTAIDPATKLNSDFDSRTQNGKEVIWYNAGNYRLIAVVKLTGVFNEILTLFAYIFGCFLIFYLVELLAARLMPGSYRLRGSWQFAPLSIRSKIRRTVIIISLASFILIGIVTVYFFNHRYQSENNNRLTQLVAQVENDLQTLSDIQTLFADTSKPGNEKYTANSSTVSLVAELLNIDVNLFSLQGNLTATSQPVVFDRGVLAPKMNPVAYYQMAVKKQVQFLQTETVGNLTYEGIYLPVRSGTGNTLGFINIPYFNSQADLSQEISNFLVTLINLIAFISIIAGIVAFFITNSITSSFYIIGQKMKAINLGTTNEPIEWNRNDEIGILVQQYNKMLEQLDESARRLSISEREFAWREMAKQVAHEIKNPLTPMKLNLQYLQRQIELNAPNMQQIASRMADSLVAQIDHLSRIASDFSLLARINVTRTEQFDLHEVLQQVAALYQMDNHITLSWQKTSEPVVIEADRTQINRLFTNLIKNASEAVSDKKAIISLHEKIENATILVGVTDNGPGIPDELREQLFMPNFTTKTSGTGLGLAICKDIAERAGGAIWLQPEKDMPTTFWVKLPLI